MRAEKGQRKFRVEAVKAATDLGYGNEVIAEIRNAKTDAEVAQIMCTARQRSVTRREKKRECQQRTDFLTWALV